MTFRAGAFSGLRVQNVRPPTPPIEQVEGAQEEEADVTLRWGKESSFSFYGKVNLKNEKEKSAAVVRNAEKIVFETRVEDMPAPFKWRTQDYTFRTHAYYNTYSGIDNSWDLHYNSVKTDELKGETWTDFWVVWGTESHQEISGVTYYADGGATPHYRDVEVEHIFHFNLTKNPSTPRLYSDIHEYES